jgi:hypothetical protein
MYLKGKFHTLKMRGSDSVAKHVHLFRTNLHQLTIIGATVLNDETIICLMRSVPPSFRTFISSLRRQPNLTLQSLIIDLIQKETLMKDMNLHNESSLALYVGEKYSTYNNKKCTKYNKFFPPKHVATTSSQFFDKKKVKCFYCKKLGHLIKDCKKRIVEEANSNGKRQSNIVIKNNSLYVATYPHGKRRKQPHLVYRY